MADQPEFADAERLNRSLPRHVAIIMDGNGRWAERRHLPRYAGHRAGVKAVRTAVEVCSRKGIKVLTLFAFSSENWRRPEKEVGLLMDLFLSTLQREIKKLHDAKVRLRFIGDRQAFPDKLVQLMNKAEERTVANAGLTLAIAVNYGGRWDITQAVRRVGSLIEEGKMTADAVTAEDIARHVCLSELPEPDLFIRTGGEKRISNFLLWQLAYAELYFTDTLWPDFDEASFDQALASFAGRQRRFGLTGKQVEQLKRV